MKIETTLKDFYPLAYKKLSSIEELPLSQEIVFLSEKNWQSIKKMVQIFYQLKEDSAYQKLISKNLPEIAKQESQQNSPLMAYDFHLQTDSVKMIEVNTNASAFLLAHLLYQSFSESFENSVEELKKAFLTEWSLFNPHKKRPQIVLIDEEIEKQRMRFEFFMYQDFFKSMGWDLEILESKSLSIDEEAYLYTPEGKKIDFIYNRATDFYFDRHPKLKKAYQEKTCLILPQPRDYALLSDKKRLLDWQDLPQLQPIQKYLLKIKPFTEKTKEELWKDRKKYFFKIQQGYGGKLAYRGSSLSHNKKEELLNYESLAQEYCPPSTLTDSQGAKWKIDLRAYAYKDQVQQLIARIYQGQLTNFKAKGSGFARVKMLPR